MKKILLFAAGLALAAPVIASAGTPDVVKPSAEAQAVYEGVKCLGHSDAYAKLAQASFTSKKDDLITSKWMLNKSTHLVKVFYLGGCRTMPFTKEFDSVRASGVAYIPKPPESSDLLLEIQVNPDGSRIFALDD